MSGGGGADLGCATSSNSMPNHKLRHSHLQWWCGDGRRRRRQ
jgi:hypothetical protein